MKNLTLKNVCKFFTAHKSHEAVQALNRVTFTVESGEYVCILGRSGCGKSTLLNIIAGLDIPDSGIVLLDDIPITGPDRHRMLMFQDAALFPWLDVTGNVLYSLKLVSGLSDTERKERVKSYLEIVGLTDYAHFRIHELSGGMRQRTALARALAPNPEILLMDEPFSALDAMTREQLYADMQDIWESTKKTVIMVTHNVREAVCMGTRVLLMAPFGELIGDERIDLPYPRQMNDPELTATAARISSILQQS